MDLQTYKNLKNNKIIHFVANWCMACTTNNSILKDYMDYVVMLDYDENPEIVKYENITKVPTIICNMDGKQRIDGISVVRLKRMLKSFH